MDPREAVTGIARSDDDPLVVKMDDADAEETFHRVLRMADEENASHEDRREATMRAIRMSQDETPSTRWYVGCGLYKSLFHVMYLPDLPVTETGMHVVAGATLYRTAHDAWNDGVAMLREVQPDARLIPWIDLAASQLTENEQRLTVSHNLLAFYRDEMRRSGVKVDLLDQSDISDPLFFSRFGRIDSWLFEEMHHREPLTGTTVYGHLAVPVGAAITAQGYPVLISSHAYVDDPWSTANEVAQWIRDRAPKASVTLVEDAWSYAREAVEAHKTPPPGWRSDAPLIEYVERTYGARPARTLQNAPLILLSDADKKRLEEIVPWLEVHADLTHRPWEECIVDVGVFPTDSGTYAHVWTRITSWDRWHQTLEQRSPWLTPAARQVIHEAFEEDWLLVESFIHNRRYGWRRIPMISGINERDNTDGVSIIAQIEDEPEEQREERETAIREINAIGVYTLAYCCVLDQMPEYLVERREPVSPKEAKHQTKDKKLWTRKGLPHIVLKRPGEIVVRDKSEPVGTHASPKGHIRSGHDRFLKAPKFYEPPWDAFTVGDPLMCPPDMEHVFYQTPWYIAGLDRTHHLRIYKEKGDAWWELKPRGYFVKEMWVGPLEGEDEAGTLYRVLLKESKAETATTEASA